MGRLLLGWRLFFCLFSGRWPLRLRLLQLRQYRAVDLFRIFFDQFAVFFRHLLTLLRLESDVLALLIKVLYAFRRFFNAMRRLRRPSRCFDFWFADMFRTFFYVSQNPLKVLSQWSALFNELDRVLRVAAPLLWKPMPDDMVALAR